MSVQKTKKLVACPKCHFPNGGAAVTCLQCKGPLPAQEATPAAGSAAPARPGPGPGGPAASAAPNPGSTVRLGGPSPAQVQSAALAGQTVRLAGGGVMKLGPLAGPQAVDPKRPAVDDDDDDGEFTLPASVAALPTSMPPALGSSRVIVPPAAPKPTAPAAPKVEIPAPAQTRRYAPPGMSAAAVTPPPTGTPSASAPSDGTQRLRRQPSDSEVIQPPVSQVPAVDPNDPRIKAWLVCEPFKPVPVGTKSVLTLGRGPQSDFVLPHSGVSRTHAVVRVTGPDLLFEDRSSYGSYRNGERVLTAKLEYDDTILIGPYELRLRKPADLRGQVFDGSEETRPLGSMRTLPTAEVMSGRVEKQPLAEVLQAVEFNQKTGTLEVFADDGTTGQLVTYEGRPMFATYGQKKDHEAVYAMVALKRGYFSFRSKIEAGEQTLNGTITSLLLEASRRIDDASQG